MKMMKLMGKFLMLVTTLSLMNIAFAFEEGSFKGKDNKDVKYNFLVKKIAEREGSYIALLIKNQEADQVTISPLILDSQDQSKMVGYTLSLDSGSRLSHHFTNPQFEMIEAGKTFTLFIKELNTSIVFKDKSDNYTWSWVIPEKYGRDERSDELSIGAFNPSTQSINGLDQRAAESFVLNRLMFGLFSKNILTQASGESVQKKEGAQMGVFLVHKGFLSRKHELHIFNTGSVSTIYKLKE